MATVDAASFMCNFASGTDLDGVACYGVATAHLITCTAFYAFGKVQIVDLCLESSYGAGRAGSNAPLTASTSFRDNSVFYEGTTDTGRATLIEYVGLILMAKIPKGGQYRVGSGLSQAT